MNFPRLSLLLMSLLVLRNIRYFTECLSTGIFQMFFSWLYWSCKFWGGNSGGREPFLQLHIKKGPYCQYDLSLLTLTLITWLKQCMSGLSTVQLLVFFSLPTVSSLEGSHYEPLVLKDWGRHRIYIDHFRVLLHRRFASSHNYVFIQSLIYVSMNSRIFILWCLLLFLDLSLYVSYSPQQRVAQYSD